ncbi:hypothetical protein ACLB2K_050770 [Fragaria x ananassa]
MAESSEHLEQEAGREEQREPIVARTPKARGSSRGTRRGIQEETSEGEPRELNAQEIAEAMEGIRAQIARLEQQRVKDQEKASGRERRPEKENTTLMSAMSRGKGQREALDRAAELDRVAKSDRAATSRLTGVRPGANRRTVHIRTNLFPDEMRNDGPSPVPEPILYVHAGRSGDMEETLRAIKDNVASLAKRVTYAERRGGA